MRRRYNLELTELVKNRAPYSALEMAAICDRLGDTLEAERWREDARADNRRTPQPQGGVEHGRRDQQ